MAASANVPLEPTIIAKEALAMLENSMVMGRTVHRQYVKEFRKIGETVTIRKPVKFRVTEARQRVTSTITEQSTTLEVKTQAHVSWAFSSIELTMSIEEYSERYIKPAANALANSVDVKLAALYKDVHNQVGTPGTTPSTFAALGAAQQRLDEEAVPSTDRVGILNPAANWALADGLKGTFAAKQASDILTRGYLGTIANLDLHMDQNIQSHTTGIFTTSATPVVKTTSTTADTTLSSQGWNASTSTVKDGDVFTVATVYAVNPVSGASTGVLKQWVVTANTTADGSGFMLTMPVSPTIKYTGSDPYDNCSALPAAADAMTFVGTESTEYPQNLVYHPNAFALVTVPLAMPANVWGARESFNGLSLRVVKQYDILEDDEVIRLDLLYGVKTLYPELAVRLTG